MKDTVRFLVNVQFILALVLGFQLYSPDVFALWATVKDPETGKMVTIRAGRRWKNTGQGSVPPKSEPVHNRARNPG